MRLILTGRICASKGSGSPGAVQRSGTGFLKLSGDASTTAAFEFGRTSACSSGIFASSTTALSDSWSKEAASQICADGSRWGALSGGVRGCTEGLDQDSPRSDHSHPYHRTTPTQALSHNLSHNLSNPVSAAVMTAPSSPKIRSPASFSDCAEWEGPQGPRNRACLSLFSQ